MRAEREGAHAVPRGDDLAGDGGAGVGVGEDGDARAGGVAGRAEAAGGEVEVRGERAAGNVVDDGVAAREAHEAADDLHRAVGPGAAGDDAHGAEGAPREPGPGGRVA